MAVAKFAGTSGHGVTSDLELFDGSASYSTNPSAPGIDCAWDFGDGTRFRGCKPVHSFMAVGDYTVTLTAFNTAGQSATATLRVTVDPPPGHPVNWAVAFDRPGPMTTAPDGTIYVGSGATLLALNPSGQWRWRSSTAAPLVALSANDSQIFATESATGDYALSGSDTTPSALARFDSGGAAVSSDSLDCAPCGARVTVNAEGDQFKITSSSSGYQFELIRSDGTSWSAKAGGMAVHTAALAPDGTLVLGGEANGGEAMLGDLAIANGSFLLKLDRSGSIAWRFEALPGVGWGSLAFADDGSVVAYAWAWFGGIPWTHGLTLGGDVVIVLNPDGTPRAYLDLPQLGGGAVLAIHGDSVALATATGGGLSVAEYSLDGEKRWWRDFPSSGIGQFSVGFSGDAVVASATFKNPITFDGQTLSPPAGGSGSFVVSVGP